MSIAVDWVEFVWKGTVSGDILGTITITPGGATYPGKTEHFVETWVITTADGIIEGFDQGVWRFKNLKFVCNGEVTDASEALSYLGEYNVHVSAVTSEFLGLDMPLTAEGTMLLLPPN